MALPGPRLSLRSCKGRPAGRVLYGEISRHVVLPVLVEYADDLPSMNCGAATSVPAIDRLCFIRELQGLVSESLVRQGDCPAAAQCMICPRLAEVLSNVPLTLPCSLQVPTYPCRVY